MATAEWATTKNRFVDYARSPPYWREPSLAKGDPVRGTRAEGLRQVLEAIVQWLAPGQRMTGLGGVIKRRTEELFSAAK